MRVMFYYSAPGWTGGARVFVAAARGLAARGYQVTFACRGGGSVEARAAAEGCDVVALETSGSIVTRGWRLQRLLTERFIETVFVHTEKEQLDVSIAMRIAARGGVVRRVPAGTRPAVGRATKTALRLATGGFVFTTQAEAAAVPKPARARDPVVADLGVDVSRYDELRAVSLIALGATSPDAKLIVCAYDVGGKAQVATVLRTMALLAPRHPELHLAILGAESNDEDLKMHAASLGLGRRVAYLGERDDEFAVLQAAHLGWVVATEDTGGFTSLDVMAMGIPVLADRGTVAARYLADGITGTLLTPGDPPGTAAVVAGLLAQDDRRRAMGSAGRARVARKYTESAMIDALQEAADSARDRTRWQA
jgi:Glycosyl transferases group 1